MRMNPYLAAIVIWAVSEYISLGSNSPGINHSALEHDTLKISIEHGKKKVSDTLRLDLFTGQSVIQTFEIKNKNITHHNYEIINDYQLPETNVLVLNGIELGEGILYQFDSWTLEAWIFCSGEISSMTIYGESKEILGSRDISWFIREGEQTFSFDNYGSSEQHIDSGPDLRDSTWHHVASILYRNTLHLYLDGILIKTDITDGKVDSGTVAQVGCRSMPLAQGEGYIYDLRIWDYARSDNEIKANMFKDLVGNEEGLVGYWKFNTGSKKILFDRSKQGRNGMLEKSGEWLKKTAPYSIPWIRLIPEDTNVSDPIPYYFTLDFNATKLHDGTYLSTVELKNRSSGDTALRIPISLNVRDAPDIFLFSDTISCDEVVFRSAVTMNLPFRNLGYDTLIIHGISVDNANFKIDNDFMSLPSGATGEIKITYFPGIFGRQFTNITITSNDPDQPEIKVFANVGHLIIPGIFFYRWLSIALIILVITILLYIFSRIRLKHKRSKMLKDRIDKAVKAQEQQQQIILHQSSLTMLGEMSAGIAEEINVIIKDISFASRDIRNDNAIANHDAISFHDRIADIYKNVEKINKLIDHVRVFSSLQKSDHTDKYSLNDVIADALSMVRVKLRNLNVRADLQLSKQLPVLTGNPYKIEQVIMNLLNNAMDAFKIKDKMKQGLYRNKIIIRTYQSNGYIVTEISDNGIGIGEKELSLIFKPFYTTKEMGEAAGLGLSISQALLHEMNGAIYIESVVEEGTICVIKLPVDE